MNEPVNPPKSAGRPIAMAKNGQLIIPSDLRKELGLEEGGTLLISVRGGEIRLRSPREHFKSLLTLFKADRGGPEDTNASSSDDSKEIGLG